VKILLGSSMNAAKPEGQEGGALQWATLQALAQHNPTLEGSDIEAFVDLESSRNDLVLPVIGAGKGKEKEREINNYSPREKEKGRNEEVGGEGKEKEKEKGAEEPNKRRRKSSTKDRYLKESWGSNIERGEKLPKRKREGRPEEALFRFGWAEMRGRRPEQQDTMSVVPCFRYCHSPQLHNATQRTTPPQHST